MMVMVKWGLAVAAEAEEGGAGAAKGPSACQGSGEIRRPCERRQKMSREGEGVGGVPLEIWLLQLCVYTGAAARCAHARRGAWGRQIVFPTCVSDLCRW